MTQSAKQQRFGKCLLERVIGSGARSTVYLAWHEGLQIPVAVKVMKRVTGPQEAQSTERFVREARIAAQLSHPNIVRVYDCGERGDSCYLVLEYIEGENCRDKLDQWGVFDWQRAVQIIRQVSEGLAYASRKGIIHRDLKPENIMIDNEGNARMADLGLAKEMVTHGSSATQDGDVLGTPYYMSPEQIRQPSDVDFRADIYSLGATLHHMVVGEPPFEAATPFEIMAKHLNEPLPDPRTRRPELPAALCAVIMRCMAKDPKDRYPHYAELIRDMDMLTSSAPEDVPVAPLTAPAAAPREQAAAPPALAALAASVPAAERTAVRPVELPATRVQVRARAVGVAALVGYGLLTVFLYQYLANHVGVVAATFGAAAMLLATAVCASRALRVGSGAEEPTVEDGTDGLEGVIATLCKRVGMAAPHLRVSERRDEAAFSYSMLWSGSVMHVPGRWLTEAEATEEETEAYVAECLGGVYTGDSFIRTLLAAPVSALHGARRLGARLSEALAGAARPMRDVAPQAVTLAWMLAACGGMVLLFTHDFLAGVLALGVVTELLLTAAFERCSRYGADAFAAKVVSPEAVQSLLVLRGLRGPDARRMILQCMGPEVAQAWSGHPLVAQERVPVVESAVAYYSEMEYNPDSLELARNLFSVTPAPPERLNRMSGLTGEHSVLNALLGTATAAFAAALGRSSREPLNMKDLFPTRFSVLAGAVGGALVVALMSVLYMRGSADYVALTGIVAVVALALGFAVTPGACREQVCAARLGWTLSCAAVAMTLVTMLGLCFVGTPALSHFAMEFPAGLVLATVLSAAAAALYVRIALRQSAPAADKAREKGAAEVVKSPDPAQDMPGPELAEAGATHSAAVR